MASNENTSQYVDNRLQYFKWNADLIEDFEDKTYYVTCNIKNMIMTRALFVGVARHARSGWFVGGTRGVHKSHSTHHVPYIYNSIVKPNP